MQIASKLKQLCVSSEAGGAQRGAQLDGQNLCLTGMTGCKAWVVAVEKDKQYKKPFRAQIPGLQEATGHVRRSQNCSAVSVALTEALLCCILGA